MSTFCSVSDNELIEAISQAGRRIVFVAPGIGASVAEALAARLVQNDKLDVTMILDPDEDVCRIGYGDQGGLALLQTLAESRALPIRKQRGLRIGVLLADETVLVWAPTPQSVEAVPTSTSQPNGLRLGPDPIAALEKAIAPEGTDTVPSCAEIGQTAVTPEEVEETLKSLIANAVIPVELSQITRIFSTRLQFVEFEVKNAKLSKMNLAIPKGLLNADAKEQLRTLLNTSLKAFGDMRGHVVNVPSFGWMGEPAFDKHGKPMMEPASEAGLERERHGLAREFFYSIPGYGALIARYRKQEFENCAKAYEIRLKAYSDGVRKAVGKQTEQILDEAVALVISRARHAEKSEPRINEAELRESLRQAVERVIQEVPSISIQYKDVTYEHTQSNEFQKHVHRAVPAQVLQRLDGWVKHQKAALESKQERNRK